MTFIIKSLARSVDVYSDESCPATVRSIPAPTLTRYTVDGITVLAYSLDAATRLVRS